MMDIHCSFADPGCLYRIPDPEFLLSIPDPTTTTTKEEWGRKFAVLPLVVATNFTKFKTILFLNRCRKKI
jgi:hypothetical protein